MFIIENEFISVTLSEFGATLMKVEMENRQGVKENILLTLDDEVAMKNDLSYYFGKTVGPVANRIKAGKLGKLKFKVNNGPNLNHSGENSWSAQKWQSIFYEKNGAKGVRFELKDRISGFPAQNVSVDYQLVGNVLTIKFISTALLDTYFNPTNHAYWNLSGNAKMAILNQYLQVASQEVLVVDENTLPTGEIIDVTGTAYDFQQLRQIGKNLAKLETGLDNTFVLNTNQSPQLILFDKKSGRKVSFSSNRQAVVLYSATVVSNHVPVNGRAMSANLGLAIEFQEQPDITNHPDWGSISLSKGTTIEKFVRMQFDIES